MSILPIKYLTDFPFRCQKRYGTCNVHYWNVRLSPYLILYIQQYFGLLYKDIRGGCFVFDEIYKEKMDTFHLSWIHDSREAT
jgi:hypothetical protein